MKKGFLTKTLVLLMAVVMVFGITACGGKSDIAGSYKMTAMTMGDEKVDMAELEQAGATATITLKEDGTFKLTMTGEEDQVGKWSANGSNVELTPDGEDGDKATGTYSNGKLTLTGTDITMEFTKN